VIVIPYPSTSQSESAIELSDSSTSVSELTIQTEALLTLQVTSQQTDGQLCIHLLSFPAFETSTLNCRNLPRPSESWNPSDGQFSGI